jgi:hypothetical protein
MKTNFIFLSIALTCMVSSMAFCQQPSPIDIMYSPRDNTFAISGVGGGNLYELKTAKSSTSGQISLDWNIALQDGETRKSYRDKQTTLTTVFKYNPLGQAKYNAGDTLDNRKIAFIDNELQMLLGFRVSSLSGMGSDDAAKFLRSFFVDAAMTPFSLLDSVNKLNTGFKNFNINFGFQFGYITNTSFGKVGFMINPQIDYIYLYEDNIGSRSFEALNHSSINMASNIIGAGVKIYIPINDFSFFFEARKYKALNNPVTIPGLTDRPVISFGAVATGNVFNTEKDSDYY